MLTAVPTITLVALLGAGCGAGSETSNDPGVDGSDPTTPSSRMPPASRRLADEPEEGDVDPMNIQIRIGDQTLTATLDDSPAARDLLAQLPVTVDMTDHGGVEKTGPLPGSLSLDGQPEGADPDPGDLGYYAPGNDLVLYHGDQSYYAGIVVLGRLGGDAAERIAEMDGSITATVAAG
jgi:hypothetical protein